MIVIVVVVAVIVIVVFRLHALGPSALTGHSTTRVTVVAAAVVDVPQLDQIVFDQPVDRMTPTNRSAQVRDRVTNRRPWVLGHGVLLSSGPDSWGQVLDSEQDRDALAISAPDSGRMDRKSFRDVLATEETRAAQGFDLGRAYSMSWS